MERKLVIKMKKRVFCLILTVVSIISCFSFNCSAATISDVFNFIGTNNKTDSTASLINKTLGNTSVISDGVYSIRLHDSSSLCMNVLFADKVEDKAQIGVDNWNGEPNETWRITNRGSGYVSIHPLHSEQLCLNSLLGKGCKPGTLLTLHKYAGGDDACLWKPIKNADGSFTFRNKASGLVMDVTDGRYSIGNKVINWHSNSYLRAQGFFVKAVSSENNNATGSIETGWYKFVTYNNPNNVWNIQFASREIDKAKVCIDPFDNQKNEVFYVAKRQGDYVSIHPGHDTSLCLNALYGSKCKAGTPLTLHNYENGDAASLWLPISNGDGSYSFKNKASGLMIDLTNGDCNKIGNRLIMYSSNKYRPAQAAYVVKVNAPSASTPPSSSGGSWQYPMTDFRVCGNDWSEYYSERAKVGRPDHVGIDIAGSSSSVVAAANGTIVAAGYNGANGNFVLIQHNLNGKTVYSFYGHLDEIEKRSGSVNRGTKIGKIGNSGSSSKGTHLHFAIVNTKMSNGGYYGYVPAFKGDKVTYGNVTFYNPHYVIKYQSLPN